MIVHQQNIFMNFKLLIFGGCKLGTALPWPLEIGAKVHIEVMSYYLLTIRYHSTNNDYFEDLIPFFLNYIKNFKNITSIEKDGTTERHLHSIFEADSKYAKDRFALASKINTAFKTKINMLKDTPTRYNAKMNIKGYAFFLNNKEEPEELYYRLGYPLKENPVRLYYVGFTEMELKEYQINYKNFLALENKKPENVDSFTHLTIKNVIPKVFDYIRKNKEKLTMDKYGMNLQILMEKDGYIFIELNEKHMKYLRRFIRIHFNDDDYDRLADLSWYDDPEIRPYHNFLQEIEQLKQRLSKYEIP